MTTPHQQNERASESGNVLFLILIAVALFAALSYAVTQSSRSGGGDAGEKTLVSSSAITQYPAGVRTAIVRMVIAGISVNDLLFDAPENFNPIEVSTSPPAAELKTRAVFYPTPGGGATYQKAPVDVMASGQQGVWIFSANYQVKNIGSTDSSSGAANDIVAFLPGLNKALCAKLDTQLGIALDASTGEPPTGEVAAPTTAQNMVFTSPGAVGIPATPTGGTIGGATAALTGQPFGCFKSTDASYVYYHVLVER